MSTAQLTHDTPLSQRLLAWSSERWPVANAVLVLFVYLTALLFGEALTHRGALSISAGDVAAFAGVLAYSLLMRVLDEHKDFDVDLENHPDRVLQSGLVTLRHLKVAGAAALGLTLLVSLLQDGGIGPVTMWWALLMAWTLLMLKEFFAGEWLRERRILYASTHMVAMPLFFLWMAQMGADGRALPGSVLWLALLSFLIGAGAEVGRKFQAPDDERPTLDSYTKILGTKGAPLTVAVILTVSAPVAAFLLGAAGEGSVAAFAGLALALVPGLAGAARFAGHPTRENGERAEATTGLTILLQLVVLIVALLAGRGVTGA
jgi:hypothetical protein